MINKVLFIIKPHSVIDVITNSSTELFIVDSTKTEGVLKEVLEFLISEGNSGYSETTIELFSDYKYKNDYILPENIKEEDLYVFDVDYSDTILEKLINKYFTIINLKYKDEY